MTGGLHYRVVSLEWAHYADLLEEREHPLYFAPWWLEVVLRSEERICLGCYDGAQCLAVFVARRLGAQIITPPYCQYAGVLFLEDSLTDYDKQRVTEAFHAYEVLPRHAYYHLSYPPHYTDWLAHYWLGYRQTTRYNFVWNIAPLPTSEALRQSISRSQRKNLKATERAGFAFLPSVPLTEAERILASTAAYKGYKSDLPLMLRLIERGLTRGSAHIVGVANAEEALAMVAFWVEHQGVAYLIGEGTDRARGGKYQLKLFMLMHYIELCRGRIGLIDFEGSMLEPIAKIYQALGAEQHSYMSIVKGWRHHPLVLCQRLLARCFKT